MRILNRPMFKYGGPIKEGVMHGMRNNYQSGQLVRPGPGRPGYQGNPYSTNYNLIDWKNANKPYRPINIQSISEVGSSPSNATKIQKAKNLLKSSKFSERGIYDALKKYIPKAWGGIKAGTRFGLQRFPLITTGVAGEYLTRPRDIDKLVFEQEDYGPWEGRMRKILDPTYNKKWIEAAKKYNFDKKVAKDKITETGTGLGAGAQFKESTAPIITDSMRDKLAKDQQNARLKSYLDMMGYDSAKKTAMSDALIDASALVQDATTEAGSIKKADWGKLINKAIQTTSKRMDKPEQIREAVGLMSVKAAIEKDITKETDALKTKALKLNIEKAQKDLKGTSFFDEVSIAQKAGAGGQTATDRGARNVSADEGIKWRGNIINKEDFKDTFAETKEDTGLDDVTIVENWVGKKIDEGLKVNDGNYTVGDYLVTIKDSVVVNVR